MKNNKNRHILLILILLIIYVIIILSNTLLFRHPFEGNHLNMNLFWSYKVLKDQWIQMAENVLLFIPLGILLSILIKQKWLVFLIGFVFSSMIEFLQYILKLGLCELDDIFHNSLGLVIGIIFVYIFNKILFISSKKNKH